MKRITHCLLFLLNFVAIAILPGLTDAQSQSYSITGYVRCEGTSAPPTNTLLTAVAGSRSYSSFVSANSFYNVGPITTGNFFTITPSKQFYEFTPPFATGSNTGGSTVVRNFIARPLPGATRLVSGTITWAGAPVPGVTVTGGSASVQSDAAGGYRIQLPVLQQVTLTFTKPGYTFNPVNITADCNDIGNQDVTAINGPGGTANIAVTVLTNQGGPLDGVEISDPNLGSGFTDANGNFTYANVPIGTQYSITAELDGYNIVVESGNPSGTLTGNIQIRYRATAIQYTISGVVTRSTGGVLGNVTITAVNSVTNAPLGTTQTNLTTGAYSFGTFPYGTPYRITPSLAGFTFAPANAEDILLSNKTHNFVATSTAPTTGNINITVTGPNGGLTGVTFGQTCGTVQSVGSGSYQIQNVNCNTSCPLTPVLTGYTFSPTNLTPQACVNPNASFTGTPNQHTVSGTVSNSAGGTLDQVTITAVNSVTNQALGTASTSGAGTYSFTFPFGTPYRLTPSRTGFTFQPTTAQDTVNGNKVHNFVGTAIPPSTGNINITVTGPNGGLTGVTFGQTCGTVQALGGGSYQIQNIPCNTNCPLTPVLTGYTFSPTTLTPLACVSPNASFTGTPVQFTVSGTVNNSAGGTLDGVNITAINSVTNQSLGSALTANGGTYGFSFPFGTPYVLTPSRSGFTFQPTSAQDTVNGNKTHNFTGTAIPPSTGNINITVTGPNGGLPGVTFGSTCGTVQSLGSGSYQIQNVTCNTNCPLTPVLTGYTFSPAMLTPLACVNPNASFVGTPNLHTVSGTVSNSAGGTLDQVTITAINSSTNQALGSTSTANGGTYSFTFPFGTPYRLTPSRSGFTFQPTSAQDTVNADKVHNFIGTAIPPSTGNINITVTGPNGGLTGVTFGSTCGTVQSLGNGNYQIQNVACNTSCPLTPALTGFTFSPANLTPQACVNPNVNFTGTPNQHTVSGTVSNSAGGILDGVAITAINSATNQALGSTSTGNGGTYSFTFPFGTPYILTPSRNGFTFQPTTAQDTVNGNKVHNFTGTANPPSTGNINITVTGPNGGLTGVTFGPTCGTVQALGGGNYSIQNVTCNTNCTLTPVLNGYTFSPTTLTPLACVSPNASFTGTPVQFTVSGTVSNSAGGTLDQVNISAVNPVNNQPLGSTFTQNGGTYSFSFPFGTQYLLTPLRNGFNFTPSSAQGTVDGNKVHNFTGTANPPSTGNINITVTGPNGGLTGVTFGPTCGTVQALGGGNYSIQNVTCNTNCTLTPVLNGYTFSPTTLIPQACISPNASFTGTPVQFTVSGTVSNSAGGTLDQVTIAAINSVTNQALGSTMTANGGAYSFSFPFGTPYILTPSKSGFTFQPPSAQNTVDGNKVHNFTGTANPPSTGNINITVTGPNGGLPGVIFGPTCGTVQALGGGSYVIQNITCNTTCVLTPTLNGFTFAPTSLTPQACVSPNASFTGTPTSPTTGNINITVTGPNGGLTGVTFAPTCGTVQSLGNGSYTIQNVTCNTTCVVTPTLSGFTFAPLTLTPQACVNPNASFTGTPTNQSGLFTITGPVTLASLSRTPMPGVKVELTTVGGVPILDGGGNPRMTLTDSAGVYTFPQMPDGLYELKVSQEGFSFKPDAAANLNAISPTNPGREYRGTPIVKNPVFTVWNSFLRQSNVLELVNTGARPIRAVVTFFDIGGAVLHVDTVPLDAFAERDRIVNDYPGFRTDTYGLLRVEFRDAATNNLTDTFDGRLSFYRQDENKKNYEFVYFMPFVTPLTGKSYVLFNTNQPSLNPSQANNLVPQWMQIVNLDPVKGMQFTLRYFNLQGQEVHSTRNSLPPFGRLDIQGGHERPGPGNVGTIELATDDPSVPYLAQLFRYGGNSTGAQMPRTYDWAFPLIAVPANGRLQQVPISTFGNARNWIELSNVLDRPTGVDLEFYDSQGNILGQRTINLGSRGQNHFFVNSLLPSDRTGSVQIRPRTDDSVVVQSIFYLYHRQTQSIAAMYGSQAIESFGLIQCGTYNLFLSQYNWLRVMNNVNRATTVSLLIRGFDGAPRTVSATIPRFGEKQFGLHEFSTYGTRADTYGTFCITSDLEGSVSTDLLRLRIDETGEIDYASPTRVR